MGNIFAKKFFADFFLPFVIFFSNILKEKVKNAPSK